MLEQINHERTYDLSVNNFIGMPGWFAAGDPKYDIWMTHTPRGSVNDNLTSAGPDVHEIYSYAGDSLAMYTHTGTHIDMLNHFGYHGCFWNGWTPECHLGSRHWLVGGPERYPNIIARGVLLDVAALHRVECLPDRHTITPEDLRACAREQGVELRRGDVVMIRTGRMLAWPDHDAYTTDPPGIGVPAARYLCEEAGAMCIAGDSIALEVIPWDEPDAFLPVHAYMFATAGAQIIEVVSMEEIAAEKQYEFAFLGFPLKLRGATGAPMPSYAVPLQS